MSDQDYTTTFTVDTPAHTPPSTTRGWWEETIAGPTREFTHWVPGVHYARIRNRAPSRQARRVEGARQLDELHRRPERVERDRDPFRPPSPDDGPRFASPTSVSSRRTSASTSAATRGGRTSTTASAASSPLASGSRRSSRQSARSAVRGPSPGTGRPQELTRRQETTCREPSYPGRSVSLPARRSPIGSGDCFNMPTYMDMHDIPGVKAADVAGAHEADLKESGPVRRRLSPVLGGRGRGERRVPPCDAPDRETATRVHRGGARPRGPRPPRGPARRLTPRPAPTSARRGVGGSRFPAARSYPPRGSAWACISATWSPRRPPTG